MSVFISIVFGNRRDECSVLGVAPPLIKELNCLRAGAGNILIKPPHKFFTRRQSTDAPEECWHVYYGDVHAGTIAIRTGIPHDEDPWEWSCGFYPGSHPGEHTNGTAETFDQARADFEVAWRVFLSKRTEADFQAWRDQRDWTAEKYRRPRRR